MHGQRIAADDRRRPRDECRELLDRQVGEDRYSLIAAGHALELVSLPLGARDDERPTAGQQEVSHLPEPRRRIATGRGARTRMKDDERLVWSDSDVPEALLDRLPASVWDRNLQRGIDCVEAKRANQVEIAVDLMGGVRCATQLGRKRTAPELLRFPGTKGIPAR